MPLKRSAIDDFVKLVKHGECDSWLNDIMFALTDRLDVLHPDPKTDGMFREAQPGDIVVFNKTASPKYLFGVHATVVGKKKTRLRVTLNEDCGRFKAGKELGCPTSIVEFA